MCEWMEWGVVTAPGKLPLSTGYVWPAVLSGLPGEGQCPLYWHRSCAGAGEFKVAWATGHGGSGLLPKPHHTEARQVLLMSGTGGCPGGESRQKNGSQCGPYSLLSQDLWAWFVTNEWQLRIPACWAQRVVWVEFGRTPVVGKTTWIDCMNS